MWLSLGIMFGLPAGLMAFLITYNEYEKHGFRGWRLVWASLGAAVLAFVFFAGSAAMIGLLMDWKIFKL